MHFYVKNVIVILTFVWRTLSLLVLSWKWLLLEWFICAWACEKNGTDVERKKSTTLAILNCNQSVKNIFFFTSRSGQPWPNADAQQCMLFYYGNGNKRKILLLSNKTDSHSILMYEMLNICTSFELHCIIAHKVLLAVWYYLKMQIEQAKSHWNSHLFQLCTEPHIQRVVIKHWCWAKEGSEVLLELHWLIDYRQLHHYLKYYILII